jgi:UDP-glucose 4-epimerase
LVADPSRTESLLHWKAKRPLRDSVSTAWNWMEMDRRRQATSGIL